MSAIQVRDVPDDVRAALIRAARERGESLQSYLQGLLAREARAERNRAVLDDYRPLRAPRPVDVIDVIAQGRAEQDGKNAA